MTRNWRSWAVAVAVLGFSTTSAQDGDKRVPPPAPAPTNPPTPANVAPNDPTQKKVDGNAMAIINEKARGTPKREAAPPADAAARTRDGLLAYQQALAAQSANQPAEALKLAQRAKTLLPNNADVAKLLAQLQKQVGGNRALAPVNNRAKAYLAAGLARGQELLRAGRYDEGEDLLMGVLEAVQLFRDAGQVEFYRRLAERDLEEYRNLVASGVATPEATSNKPAEQPRLTSVGAAPPDNSRRLLRAAEGRLPAWYINHKNKLAAPMTVDYKRTQAAVVFDDVAQRTGVPFVIDRPVALSRAHLASLVDFRIGDVPAETVLDFACQKTGVEYVIMEKSVVITTRSKALEYIRQMPDMLRHNWAAGRVLFPEVHPELFANTEAADPASAAARAARLRGLDLDVPPHLQSGKALVAAIQALLK